MLCTAQSRNTADQGSISEGEIDVYIVAEADLLQYEKSTRAMETNTPILIICNSVMSERQLRLSPLGFRLGRRAGYLAQPCGPRRLAIALKRCLRQFPKDGMPAIEGAHHSPSRPKLRKSYTEMPSLRTSSSLHSNGLDNEPLIDKDDSSIFARPLPSQTLSDQQLYGRQTSGDENMNLWDFPALARPEAKILRQPHLTTSLSSRSSGGDRTLVQQSLSILSLLLVDDNVSL